MKKRVFIVHGWGGNPQEGWFPWIKGELENKGFVVEIPSMPDTENPKIETWIPYLAKNVGKIDENTFFVGHSIGCQTILRYLESLPKNDKVGGAVFVAGWFNLKDLDSEEKKIAKPWIKTLINFENIKQHASKFTAIFSTNDPYVPLEDKNVFESKLGAKTIIEKDKGHFDENSGITQLPIALKSLLEIRK